MVHKVLPLAALMVAAAVSPLSAQIPEWVTQMLAAAELPVVAADVRLNGVPDHEVRQVLDAMAAARLRAHEARQVLGQERDAIREHGPVDNFGAFVQSKLAAGLRGRDLAAAIKAEHVARGKGRPQGSAARPGQGSARRVPAGDTMSQRGQKAAPPGRPTQNEKAGAAKSPPATKGPPAAKVPPAAKGPTGRPDRPTR